MARKRAVQKDIADHVNNVVNIHTVRAIAVGNQEWSEERTALEDNRYHCHNGVDVDISGSIHITVQDDLKLVIPRSRFVAAILPSDVNV
jgi:hypothetical protein